MGLIFTSSFGQRVVDLETVDIVGPDRIEHGVPVTTTIAIKNNGPDSVLLSDTLVYRFLLNNQIPTAQINIEVTKELGVGDTLHVSNNFQAITINGNSFRGDICATAAIINRSEADSVVWEVEANDQNSNNRRCEEIDYIDSHGWNVGIGELGSFYSQEMEIYPNPANRYVNVSFFNPESGEATISFLDITGVQVKSTSLQVGRTTVDHQVSIEDLKAGVYTVELRTGNYVVTKKLIVTQ